MKSLSFYRRIIQLAVIFLFCLLPWLNLSGFHQLSGSLFAFDFFGIPFADPAAALQATTASLAFNQSPGAKIIFGALLALLIAFFMGRIFCGWLCPYGFFSELGWYIRKKSENEQFTSKKSLRVFIYKILIFLIALLAIAFFAFPLLSLISFPGELSLLPMEILQECTFWAIAAACGLPVIALIIELYLRRRFWCEYICPQSVMLGLSAWGLPKQSPGLRIDFNARQCNCGKLSPCRQSCSLNLNPRQKNGPSRRDCIMCGECIQTCATHGQALKWSMTKK